MENKKAKIEIATQNFSPERKEKVTKNLKVQRKHGAFEFFRKNVAPVPSCNQCIFSSECEYFKKDRKQCKAVLELQDEIYHELFNLDYIRPVDKYIIDRFVKNFCFLMIVERWIANVGPYQASDDGVDVQPILRTKTNYERLVLKQADALGIGPQARARLNLTTVTAFNFAAELQKVKPINNQTAKIIVEDEKNENNN